MTYTEDFKHILLKRDQVINANLFVFKNNTPRSIKVFPEEVSSVLLGKYFDTLTLVTEENEFVDFIPTLSKEAPCRSSAQIFLRFGREC